MLCSKCGKNEASVFFSKTINGKKTQHNLCQSCADKMGVMEDFQRQRQIIQNNFFGTDFFSGSLFGGMRKQIALLDSIMNDFWGLERSFDTLPENASSNDSCPYCGGTLQDFEKTGKFRCAMCYETFKDKIDLARVSASKKAEEKEESREDKISKLSEKISKAVKEERYEDAAKYRDEIKRIQDL
ncbi:MAG: UvrB/UvrC motif-containing protein [Clostridia bacterium]|nr:UvrB/UvrC motif-containing protein [Clostridia bacterium]